MKKVNLPLEILLLVNVQKILSPRPDLHNICSYNSCLSSILLPFSKYSIMIKTITSYNDICHQLLGFTTFAIGIIIYKGASFNTGSNPGLFYFILIIANTNESNSFKDQRCKLGLHIDVHRSDVYNTITNQDQNDFKVSTTAQIRVAFCSYTHRHTTVASESIEIKYVH